MASLTAGLFFALPSASRYLFDFISADSGVNRYKNRKGGNHRDAD
jgi:hypothetical protein